MTRYCVWLDQLQRDLTPSAGAKANNLARILQAGIPVPDGFCILADAYNDFLGLWADACEASAATDDKARRTLAGDRPPLLRAQVTQAYSRLMKRHGEGGLVAVRSSACAEDLPEASFAGQYASVLNVGDEAHLLAAIKEVWASATSARVRAYNGRAGQNPEGMERNGQMALIVQMMVPSVFAGVLFTVDPLGSLGDQILVEWAPGESDQVSSGSVAPLHLTLDRRTGAIVEPRQALASDAEEWLTPTRCRTLHALALRVEKLWGTPQDIEWVFGADQFWIVQSRPVSALRILQPRSVWTPANAGEILPQPVYPLTWSIFKPMLAAAGMYRALSPLMLHWRWRHPCGAWPDSPRLFDGRAYMELATVYAGFASLPGVDARLLQRILGFEFDLLRPDELPSRRPRWHPMDLYRGLRFGLEILGVTHTMRSQAHAQSARMSQCRKAAVASAASGSPTEILVAVKKLLAVIPASLGLHILVTSMSFSALGLLERLAGGVIADDELQSFSASLVADFREMGSARQGIAVWRLTRAAQGVPQLAESLRCHDVAGWQIADWRIKPEAAGFVQLWDQFMAEFGDRGSQEFELAEAHWEEDPSFIISSIQNTLAGDGADPLIRLTDRQRDAEARVTQLIALLRTSGSVWRSVLLGRLVLVYRKFVTLRENMKYCVVGGFNELRKCFLALGQALVAQGVLGESKDVFLLDYAELTALAQHPESPAGWVREQVVQRRELHRQYTVSRPVDVWIVAAGQQTPLAVPVSRTSTILRGIACSAGRVTGPAHVVVSLKSVSDIAPGAILVAPSTDPGWTPLFLNAAGLVTELGGILSHGATIAREYGLPAVVGVAHATEMIPNGQVITIDGSIGLVDLSPLGGEDGDRTVPVAESATGSAER